MNGIYEEQKDDLLVKKIEDNLNEEICTICLVNKADDLLSCFHTFCSSCIKDW